MSDTDPTATLASLSSSLSTLEGALAPLLAKPLDDHLDGQDPLVQARMQILASYVVHDLIWVYLKTAGVDPATHPVMAEIERLKGYFGKLKAAQSGAPATTEPAASVSRPRMAVDKRAANRFITAAISSSRPAVDPDYTPTDGEGEAEAGSSGTHIRFDEGEVERLLEDEAGGEEGAEEAEGESQVGKSVRKGKKRESEGGAAEEDEGAQAKGKKRKVLDPFAGYDQPKPSPPASSTKNPATKSSRRRSTVNAEAAAVPAADESSAAGSPAPAGNAGAGLSKSQKKKLARKQQAAAAAAAAAEGAEGKKQ
ncbi:Sas10/Utp3/C1D family protein [Rhodotorula paludigena]|uniref:Sas10/Utp3/C1D family protein n=1 Tax=Rhodotorula paludigena TaxID=86838 RepID=UPI00317DB12E